MRMSCSLGQTTNEYLMLWECPAPWDRKQTSISCMLWECPAP